MPQWKVEEITKTDYLSHVEFTTPNGFKLTLEGIPVCVSLLAALALRGTLLQPGDGSRLLLDAQGVITVIDCDSWDNSNFKYGDVVTNAPALAAILQQYILEKTGVRTA